MSWHWQYSDSKNLEQKVILANSETDTIAISISFERYPEFPESKDKDLEQIRPKRDPSKIDRYTIKGTWNRLLIPQEESIDGLVYNKYEGLKPEDRTYFTNIWNLLQSDLTTPQNGIITFSYKATLRICDVPKPKSK